MFSKIMMPVDLDHQDSLGRALDCAADLAVHYGAGLVYVGVTTALPGAPGHEAEDYAAKLAGFADAQAQAHGIAVFSHVLICQDPTTELDAALLKAVGETGADLVVMASHVPTRTDYVWPSNGGKLAAHAKVSVLVVRG